MLDALYKFTAKQREYISNPQFQHFLDPMDDFLPLIARDKIDHCILAERLHGRVDKNLTKMVFSQPLA